MTPPLSIAEAAAAIQTGRLDPRELTAQCLDRIDRYDGRIRAWVAVDHAGAMAAAEAARDELAAGVYRGPLHGIPVGIKDLIDVAGFPTLAGSPLRTRHRAESDAPIVAALRAAGVIVLGKTVTVEFAAFDPSPTRNPWDAALGHTPGGSSSGSAAAVAMGMCLGAVGTQTGGSLVRPASYCGVATCKPTFGRLGTEGIVPLAHHLDHPGPIARTVWDVAAMLRAMLPPAGLEPPDSCPPPRLGLVEPFYMERADAAVREAVGAAVARLAARGAAVEPVRPPIDFQEVLDMHWRIMAVEAAAYHRRQFAAHREQYGPMIARLLDEGLGISGVDYAAALAHQRAFRREAAESVGTYDALLMPATDTPAPPRLDTTGPRDFQAPWSYAGLPVVGFPCGLAADGMPVALQMVGRPDGESPLLRAARWCERALDFRELPPFSGGR
jgi:aspartyl-tRNA(Asn)/glutamyl-tRNA(Gln) amidotransferase subunit A